MHRAHHRHLLISNEWNSQPHRSQQQYHLHSYRAYSDSSCNTVIAAETFTTAAPSSPSSAPAPGTGTVSFPPDETGSASGQVGPGGVPVFPTLQQMAAEGESFDLQLPSATSDGQTVTDDLKAYAKRDPAEQTTSADPAAATVSATAGAGDWQLYEGLICDDLTTSPVTCTVEDDNPPAEVLVVLTATVGRAVPPAPPLLSR